MRTLDLIKALSEKELKLIEHELVSGKRKTLLPLFKELKKLRQKETKPDRTELYKKIYGSAYSKSKDYLLRNELRLLNEVIYEYLVFDCFKEHVGKNKSLFNRWLAQSYYNRKISVFAEDINDFIADAKNRIQTEEATLLYALRTAWASNFPVETRENTLAQLQEWKDEEKRRLLHRLRKIEYSQVFFEENWIIRKSLLPGQPDDWTQPGEMNVDLSGIDRTDWYTRYLTLQKYYWQSKSDEQLKYLEEIIKLSGNEQARNVIKIESHIVNIEGMAYSLFMNGRHDQAAGFMEEPLKLSEKNHLPVSPSHLVLYIANMLLTSSFSEAISLYKKHKAIIDVSTSRGHGIIVTAYCYLFVNCPDEALQLVAQGVELETGETIHIRYVYTITFLLRKQYDLALNEIRNMKRTLTNSSSPSKESDLNIVSYFNSYIKALQQNKSNRAKLINALHGEVIQNFKSYKPLPHVNLQLNWLLKQLRDETQIPRA